MSVINNALLLLLIGLSIGIAIAFVTMGDTFNRERWLHWMSRVVGTVLTTTFLTGVVIYIGLMMIDGVIGTLFTTIGILIIFWSLILVSDRPSRTR